MEGSPVRGQQKVAIVQLNESPGVENFQAEIIRLISSEFKTAQIIFGVADADAKSLQLPAWIKSHLERHTGLQKKLEQGEMVGISAISGANASAIARSHQEMEDSPLPRPATAARSNVVLIPLISEGRLRAAIGLVSSLDQPPLSAEEIETARQLAYEAAPILARLQEIEGLRRANQALLDKVESAQSREEEVTALREKRNALDAILQMRSHQLVNVAHELRTPMAAIRGYARMILDGRAGAINEKQTDYLRIVTDNTNRLITLVAWMSYVAELSAQHLKVSSFDFRDVWIECADGNQQRLDEKSLKLNQQVSEESFPVIGDREKLAYVVNELLAIAITLAEAGGTIAVELSHGRERDVTFKLSEKGADIPAEVMRKIFDRPFNTIAKPAGQNTESNALSLSGVYDVLGMHGGRVFVNSTAGQGATFLFTLPAVTAGAEEESHEQAVNFSRRRR
jgi:signal transduction histidine kinase